MLKLFVAVSFILFGLLFFQEAHAITNVYLDNQTSFDIQIDTGRTGHKLSRKKWKAVTNQVPKKSRRKIVWFNRDSGIKNKKNFYFFSNLTFLKNGEEVSGQEVELHQKLRGKTINSRMWQSVSIDRSNNYRWYRDRKWHYSSAKIGNSYVSIKYRAKYAGTDDNIIYQISEIPILSVEKSNTLHMINYNIYMRPTSLFKNGQSARSMILSDYLKGKDFIVFSEAFDDSARNKLRRGLKADYPYGTKVVGSDRGFEQDGGVIAYSKWPILEQEELLFGNICHKVFEDCLSDKGILYFKIIKGDRPYHIFATHLQAGYTATDRVFRRAQLHMMRSFLERKNISKDEAVIFTGDFNVPEEPTQYEMGATTSLQGLPSRALNYFLPIMNEEQAENTYEQMLLILNAETSPNQGIPYSFDPSRNRLAKQSEPAEFVDHIFWSKGHLVPERSTITVKELKAQRRWRLSKKSPLYRDLSDHFPVEGELTFPNI